MLEKIEKNIKKRGSNQNKETYLEILRMENCNLTNQVFIGYHVYLIQMKFQRGNGSFLKISYCLVCGKVEVNRQLILL